MPAKYSTITITKECRELYELQKRKYESGCGPATHTHYLNVLLNRSLKYLKITGRTR